MLVYEVTAQVSAELHGAYEHYMREEHIPAVLATGCFLGATFERTADGRFRTCYRAGTQAALDGYLRDHTAGLRADFAARFPAGVTLSREVWSELQGWTRPA